jgi:hypothetical protein
MLNKKDRKKLTTASNREQARFLLQAFWLERETKPVLGTLAVIISKIKNDKK